MREDTELLGEGVVEPVKLEPIEAEVFVAANWEASAPTMPQERLAPLKHSGVTYEIDTPSTAEAESEVDLPEAPTQLVPAAVSNKPFPMASEVLSTTPQVVAEEMLSVRRESSASAAPSGTARKTSNSLFSPDDAVVSAATGEAVSLLAPCSTAVAAEGEAAADTSEVRQRRPSLRGSTQNVRIVPSLSASRSSADMPSGGNGPKSMGVASDGGVAEADTTEVSQRRPSLRDSKRNSLTTLRALSASRSNADMPSEGSGGDGGSDLRGSRGARTSLKPKAEPRKTSKSKGAPEVVNKIDSLKGIAEDVDIRASGDAGGASSSTVPAAGTPAGRGRRASAPNIGPTPVPLFRSDSLIEEFAFDTDGDEGRSVPVNFLRKAQLRAKGKSNGDVDETAEPGADVAATLSLDNPARIRRRRDSLPSVPAGYMLAFPVSRQLSSLPQGSPSATTRQQIPLMSVDDLWQTLCHGEGHIATFLDVKEFVDLFAWCRTAGLDTDLARYVWHDFQDFYEPEDLSPAEVAHLCALILHSEELPDEATAREQLSVVKDVCRADSHTDDNAAHGYLNLRHFRRVITLISCLMRIDEPYVVYIFASYRNAFFEMTDTLAAQIMLCDYTKQRTLLAVAVAAPAQGPDASAAGEAAEDEDSVRRHACLNKASTDEELLMLEMCSAADAALHEGADSPFVIATAPKVAAPPPLEILKEPFTLNSFTKVVHACGLVSRKGVDGIAWASLNSMYSETLRNTRKVLFSQAEKRRFNLRIVRDPSVGPKAAGFVGRSELAILMQAVFDALPKSRELKSPLQMCVMFLRRSTRDGANPP